MAKLVLTADGAIQGHYFLEKKRLTIGRLPHNGIVLDSNGVSKNHASILVVGNDYIVEDSRSSNGTLVNGRRVERHVLQHGDVVEIAGFHLKYMNNKTGNSTLEKTTFLPVVEQITARMPVLAPSDKAPANVATAKPVSTSWPTATLEIIGGARSGRPIALDRVVTLIGMPGRQTAVVTRRPHGYCVTHVEGKHTPRVNKRSIGREPHLLSIGDIIEVDDEIVRYRLS